MSLVGVVNYMATKLINRKGRFFQAMFKGEQVLIRAYDVNQADKYLKSQGEHNPNSSFAHDYEIEFLRSIDAPVFDILVK